MASVEDREIVSAVSADGLSVTAGSVPQTLKPTLRARAVQVTQHRETRRLVAFLFAGGVAAICTITSTALLDRFTPWPFVLSAALGTEIGILVSFMINDLLAFRDLARDRHITLRAMRFHVTCAIGQTVILILSVLLHDTWHWWSALAQGVPIILVTGLNFTLHRLWTYRTDNVPSVLP
jgi:putative flippase GtrA